MASNNDAYGKRFAEIYDFITRHKDYRAEVNAVDLLLRSRVRHGATVLDLGCGTGTHAIQLAERGYALTGVDLSADMIAVAARKTAPATFLTGSLADLQVGPFDACVSLFNVVNCIPDTAQLHGFLSAIAGRLKPGGLLLLECWNPVAIIQSPPITVERRFETADYTIVRKAEPSWNFMALTLDIAYHITYTDNTAARPAEQFDAIHHLRLFTPTELTDALCRCGFMDIEIRTALPDLAAAGDSDRMLAVTCRRAI